MRVGLASIYSWRPHVEHLIYLAEILAGAGHETHFLTCDSSVPVCYSRLLKGRNRLSECAMCIAGGVRSYALPNIQGIRSHRRTDLDAETLRSLASSSSYSLQRTETPEDSRSDPVAATQRRLAEPVRIVAANARSWVRDKRLDAVLCFNGRMDLTRAIIWAAAQEGVPFATVERPVFSHGVQLIPNANCLSLADLRRMSRTFRDRPLKAGQAREAARAMAMRMARRGILEWRHYNPAVQSQPWPASGSGPRILILPSSRSEYQGEEEWRSDFDDDLTGMYDEVIDRLGGSAASCVLRCHPNWAEPIGLQTGWMSARYYSEWARRRGFRLIPSSDRCDSFALMAQADYVLVAGSTAGLDAGTLGKNVINLGASLFHGADFAVHIRNRGELARLSEVGGISSREIVRRTLRYYYVLMARHPQYVRFVRAILPERYEYRVGADPDRIIQMLRTGQLEPDDPGYANDTREEDPVVDQIVERNWDELSLYEERRDELPPMRIQRRRGLRWIDGLRARFPKGDRWT